MESFFLKQNSQWLISSYRAEQALSNELYISLDLGFADSAPSLHTKMILTAIEFIRFSYSTFSYRTRSHQTPTLPT